jgi:predicted Ser/Thr protein kinase
VETISHFRLESILGGGGSSTVYKAFDIRTGDPVALKILRPQLVGESGYLDRFKREADIASYLHSPHVVRILESGREGQHYFLAMEYVDGPNLAEVLRSGPFSPARAISTARQICSALTEAHQYGIVHRDIKPQNIMLTSDGVVKVADFGVARMRGQAGITTDGLYLGTPEYMSPDHINGEVDARSDIYSLGVVLFQLLTGELPFKGTPLSLIDRHLNSLPPRVSSLRPEVPNWLDETVARCLEKSPALRFQTPEELATTLVREELPSQAVRPALGPGPTDPGGPAAGSRAHGKPRQPSSTVMSVLLGATLLVALVLLLALGQASGLNAGPVLAASLSVVVAVAWAVVVIARPGRRGSDFSLVFAGVRVPLRRGSNLIGRSPEARLRLQSAEVSRRHADVIVSADAVSVHDLGSDNGTFVNGVRVSQALLQVGDVIDFGRTRVILSSPRLPARSRNG